MPVITPMFNGKDIAHMNALLIQPTSHCAKNCEGCYAKNFKNADPSVLRNFLRKLDQLNFDANQITMALDTLPINSSAPSNESYMLLDFFSTFLFLSNRFKEQDRSTEFHLTVNHFKDLQSYLQYFHRSSLKLKDIKMISFSNLTDDIPMLKNSIPDTQMNWNFTLFPSNYPVIENINTLETKAKFLDKLHFVDSCYVVLHKPSTGQNVSLHAFKVFIEFKKMIDSLDPEHRAKVHFDTCYTDSQKYISTGYGCSANISKFQIWPDGSVTGCPYKQTPTTPPAKNTEQIFANFLTASSVYDFSKCDIPDTIIGKQNKLLNILEIF